MVLTGHRAVWVLQRSMLRLNATKVSFFSTSLDTELMKPVCLFTSPLTFHLVYCVFSKHQQLSLKDQSGIQQQRLIKEEKEAASILSCHLIVKQRLTILNNFLLLE